jgi:hypothetical protein
MVVTSELTPTPAVTSRKMEVNQEHTETQAVKGPFTQVVTVPAARSSYAKDREHPSSGRSPGSGSKRSSVRLPVPCRTVACSLHHKRMSCSPVTVARLRRTCTGFPILPLIEATR